jgi:ABC-type tungstate transport system substrate-binding protein
LKLPKASSRKGIALGFVLIAVAIGINAALAWLQGGEG